MRIDEVRAQLHAMSNERYARALQGFFKTGPGEYGEGDIFLGIRVPEIRKLAARSGALGADELMELLTSPIHDERMLALVIMNGRFSKGDQSARRSIYETYLGNTRHINNWDLVDLSAPHIVGAFLFDKNRRPLYSLAKSASLWERRISIVSTFRFIRAGQFDDTLRLSKILLRDREDLIHKAVGWMLREVGKRDLSIEEEFLREHYKLMPRTMLRYAIERIPEARRRRYLEGRI
ncbi:MAG TPA: DNA alkylation repair protein [Blastocatellia bacterium]